MDNTAEMMDTDEITDEPLINAPKLQGEAMEPATLQGIRIALLGRFGAMTRREAASVVRSYGGVVVEQSDSDVDWVVIGADQSPLAEASLLVDRTREAIASGTCERIHETELWSRLGLVDLNHTSHQLFTPAMLAQLLGVSVRVVRRWHRLGLITPVQTLHRLPYYDFTEVATARRLAKWIAAGESPTAIEQRLVQWLELLPGIHRPLDQLSILVEGKQVLLRGGEGLVEPGGQLRFDFDAMQQTTESNATSIDPAPPNVLAMVREDDTTFSRENFADSAANPATDELLQSAYRAEDDGELQMGIDFYHAILARDGASAEINFQIAELLYRLDELIAARERYYSAIELDPNLVEARASLGVVLTETQQHELAVAAFQGALSVYPDYSDVHYHLARTLDRLQRYVEAEHHWQRFLQIVPTSPWAEEAKARLHPQTRDELRTSFEKGSDPLRSRFDKIDCIE